MFFPFHNETSPHVQISKQISQEYNNSTQERHPPYSKGSGSAPTVCSLPLENLTISLLGEAGGTDSWELGLLMLLDLQWKNVCWGLECEDPILLGWRVRRQGRVCGACRIRHRIRRQAAWATAPLSPLITCVSFSGPFFLSLSFLTCKMLTRVPTI